MPHLRKEIAYPLWGLALAAGAPAGLLVVRLLQGGGPASLVWLEETLRADITLWVYLFTSTAVALCVPGWLLGRRTDLLRSYSTSDPLTALGNRRLFDARLAAELERLERVQSSLSLFILDVDHLKRINDEGGHPAGDAALRTVAQALKCCARHSDTLTRIGGDEFAIIAPACDAEEARGLAERLLTTLRESSEGHLTVSIGSASTSRALPPHLMVERADQALYRAKAEGRDCARAAPRFGSDDPSMEDPTLELDPPQHPPSVRGPG